MAVFEFVEGLYNPRRRYSALNDDLPIEYESRHQGVSQDSSQELSMGSG
jgi:hypothetical protein